MTVEGLAARLELAEARLAELERRDAPALPFVSIGAALTAAMAGKHARSDDSGELEEPER
jgi:hypothetical protein